MKPKRFKLTDKEYENLDGIRRNDYHRGVLTAPDVYFFENELSKKVKKYLCGMKDCSCGANGSVKLIDE